MTAGKFNDLRHFSFRHLVGEHPANTHAMAVDMQHHLNGFLAILVEEALENVNDELHGRVVVVQDENLVEAGLLGLWARFVTTPVPFWPPVPPFRSSSFSSFLPLMRANSTARSLTERRKKRGPPRLWFS